MDKDVWTYMVDFTIMEAGVWKLYIVQYCPVSGFTQQGGGGGYGVTIQKMKAFTAFLEVSNYSGNG